MLEKLHANVALNSQSLSDVSVSVEELDWAEVSDDRLRDINANTVIAAGRTDSPFSPTNEKQTKVKLCTDVVFPLCFCCLNRCGI